MSEAWAPALRKDDKVSKRQIKQGSESAYWHKWCHFFDASKHVEIIRPKDTWKIPDIKETGPEPQQETSRGEGLEDPESALRLAAWQNPNPTWVAITKTKVPDLLEQRRRHKLREGVNPDGKGNKGRLYASQLILHHPKNILSKSDDSSYLAFLSCLKISFS